MYAIIDKRAPQEVKQNLARHVNGLFEFCSKEITYNAISGHPDIFIFQDHKNLIVAPNSPKELLHFLNNKKVAYTLGIKPVGTTLDESVPYNCVATKKYFFCKKGKPDSTIQNICKKKQLVHLPQAYTRCSLFSIDDEHSITSDMGIVKALKNIKLNPFYFDPSQIKIIDHNNGFIGGTIGCVDDKVFFLGNLLKHKDGQRLQQYINSAGKEVVCLGNDYLYDGGGIFFVHSTRVL